MKPVPGVGLLKKLGVQLESGTFVCEDTSSLKSELQARNMFLASLPADEEDLSERLLSHFKGRKELIEVVEHKTRMWSLTDAGRAMSDDGLDERKQISEITPELLQSGEWKDADFRSFDVTLESATPRTGRSHPMQELIERIRRIFLKWDSPSWSMITSKQPVGTWMPCSSHKITLLERCKIPSILMSRNRWNWMQI